MGWGGDEGWRGCVCVGRPDLDSSFDRSSSELEGTIETIDATEPLLFLGCGTTSCCNEAYNMQPALVLYRAEAAALEVVGGWHARHY